MHLIAQRKDDFLLIRAMDDRIDAAGATQFKDRMRDLTTGETGNVVLDMSMVAFLDSSGLGAVVAVMKALGPDR
jgi:anti-sigma B factor antagonist